jgi:hypothetical protein
VKCNVVVYDIEPWGENQIIMSWFLSLVMLPFYNEEDIAPFYVRFFAFPSLLFPLIVLTLNVAVVLGCNS